MNRGSSQPSTESLWWTLANAGWVSLLVGTILGIIGLYAGWYFYRKSLPKPSVQATAESTLIIGPVQEHLTDKLEINFGGKAVPQVTNTTFALFNNGNTTFRSEDIAKADPILLSLTQGSILQVDIASVSREVIQARTTTVDNQSIRIEFDFLEPNDAIVLRVLHSSPPRSLNYSGTMVGLPQGIKPYQPFKRRGVIRRFGDKASIIILPALLIGLMAVVWNHAGWKKAMIVPAALGGMISFVAIMIWVMEHFGNRWKRAVPPTVLGNAELRRRLELTALISRA